MVRFDFCLNVVNANTIWYVLMHSPHQKRSKALRFSNGMMVAN